VVATTVAAHRQHSAATAAVTPPGAGPEGTLEAACALLCNPSGPTRRRRQWSSGAMTSTSTSSPQSTRRPMVGGGLTTPRDASAIGRAHIDGTTCIGSKSCHSRPAGQTQSAAARERTTASPSSVVERGAVTSTVTSAQQTPLLEGKLHSPLPLQDLGVVAWRLLRNFEWWSGRASSGPTCRRNTTRV
jgi:hypothetical protein